MNKAYKRRIALSKARLDDEMRYYAATLSQPVRADRVAAMVARFPAIDRAYALELVSR